MTPTSASGKTETIHDHATRPALAARFARLRAYLQEPAPELGPGTGDLHRAVAFSALLHGPGFATPYLHAYALQDDAPWLLELAQANQGQGPLRADAGEAAPTLRLTPLAATATSPKLRQALAWVHRLVLSPRESSAAHVQALLAQGWSGREISILTQRAAAVTLLARLDVAQEALARTAVPFGIDGRDAHQQTSATALDAQGFEREVLSLIPGGARAWTPWIPLETDGYDWDANFDAARASRTTFRAAAGDRELAKLLAQIEDEIFIADDLIEDGLGRRGRELGALTASRDNGCAYCTSVHAMNYAREGGEPAATLALLQDGCEAPALPRHVSQLARAATALTHTPIRFNDAHLHALADQGLSRLAAQDFIHAVIYFNFANRVVMSLGGLRPARQTTAQHP